MIHERPLEPLCRLVVLVLLGAGLAGCWGARNLADLPPDQLYRQARIAVEKHRYERAKEIIDRIRDDFPFSRYAAEAELLEADMAFDQEKFEEAAAAYRSFEELHPTHPRVAYAVYRRGLAYAGMVEPPDRDQTATRNALEAFQKLLRAYPGSEFAADARARVKELRTRLAEHEMYVARYYLRRKLYDAALGRLQELIRSYPDTPLRDEALALALQIQSRKGSGRGD